MAKRTATPADANKRTTTKPKSTGAVLPVTDPTDLWYLCEKVTYAKQNPFARADGVMMFQRVVTQLIRLECKLFGYALPYAGEVGYDMTKSPPAPIMSIKEPHRPSEFPLSQYREIKEGYNHSPFGPWLEVDKELISLGELEGGLVNAERAGMPRPFPGGKGMMRIPDVVRMTDFTLYGKAKFSQPNLHNVIEIKFEGDSLSPGQQKAYEDIAGHPNNFRLLRTSQCDGSKSRTRNWIRDAKKEPIYVPVSKAMKLAAQRRNGMAMIPEYELLVDAIDREHEEVRQRITPKPIDPNQSYLSAGPSREEELRIRQQREKARAGVEMTLALPFVGAAAGTAVVGAPILLGSAAEEVVIARTGAKIIPFPRLLRPLAPAAGAAAAAQKLAAQPSDQAVQAQTVYARPTTYVYWPD